MLFSDGTLKKSRLMAGICAFSYKRTKKAYNTAMGAYTLNGLYARPLDVSVHPTKKSGFGRSLSVRIPPAH